jgi:hypothetical protein
LLEEIHNLQANDVYEEGPIPDGVTPFTSKCVLRIKFDAKGNIERYKVRIVARGFAQRKGTDFKADELFAPVANLESIRIIMALAAKYDLELDQMDVSTAYLNGELEEELYMHPPAEVEVRPGYCWHLKRSLYGLKQAGRTWNKTLDKKLGEMNFSRLDAETCLYVYKDGKDLCFLVVYVDDLLLAATSRAFMTRVKGMLSSAFKMRDLGAAKFILGIQITRNRQKRTIALSQPQYIDTVIKRFGMEGCNSVRTPMDTKSGISADDPEDNTTIPTMEMGGRIVSYQSVVGSLMWPMLCTRPDLAYVVGVIGRFSANPKKCHWEIAK